MIRTIQVNPLADAILTVDVQTTFMPGGGLPVKDGDQVVPVVLKTEALFPRWRRFATLDQHPIGHISLASSYHGIAPGYKLTEEEVAGWTAGNHRINGLRALFTLEELKAYLAVVKFQILWSEHGIIGTPEAELHPALSRDRYAHVQIKGPDPLCDSYSGFRDNLGRSTGLAGWMYPQYTRKLFLQGLAGDFCVGLTAIDAVKEGFAEVFVIEDATRSVDLPGTVAKMNSDLYRHGVQVIESSQLVAA